VRKSESIQAFYEERFHWIPNEIKNSLGHFNVFQLQYPIIGKGAKDLEYGRREWYNIVLVAGGGIYQSSGKEYKVKNHAIAFSNPHTPFGWQERNKISKGYYCLFNEQFLNKYKKIIEFPMFKANALHLFELSAKDAKVIELLFKRMFVELSSNYLYKYDIIRLLIEDIVHITMKSANFDVHEHDTQSASKRITLQFLELLERQFPIESANQELKLTSASDFANKLNVHVNHLNKSVKENTEKSTTALIKERILQEAQTLIHYTDWNIAEIAFALGFKETTHFNNFFKKSTKLTPSQYRNL
jgi:AraC-like DNA-binding protein